MQHQITNTSHCAHMHTHSCTKQPTIHKPSITLAFFSASLQNQKYTANLQRTQLSSSWISCLKLFLSHWAVSSPDSQAERFLWKSTEGTLSRQPDPQNLAETTHQLETVEGWVLQLVLQKQLPVKSNLCSEFNEIWKQAYTLFHLLVADCPATG